MAATRRPVTAQTVTAQTVTAQTVTAQTVTAQTVTAQTVTGTPPRVQTSSRFPRRPGRDPFVATLTAHWTTLVETSGDTVARWAATHPALRGCRDADEVLAAIRDDADGCLHALLGMAHRGDELAGRTIVQTMLPKMIRQARRDPHAEVADYVAQLWVRIGTYPLARRPRRIAANLALDTLKSVKAEQRSAEQPMDDDQHRLSDLAAAADRRERLDHNAAVSELTARQVIGTATELGLIDEPTGRVLHTVYAEGLSGRQAAEALGTTVDLVRWRCSKAVRRLAENAAVLASAA